MATFSLRIPRLSFILERTAFSNPGSATRSYVKIFLILTFLLGSTKPAALEEILIGIPASTNSFAILP